MVRLKLSIELDYAIANAPCDFIFNIHLAHTRCQSVVDERLELSPALRTEVFVDPPTGSRYLRLLAATGHLGLRYEATADITHHFAAPSSIAEVPVSQLPAQVLGYIYPSRYCQSDRLHNLAVREFGHLPRGYGRVLAIQAWVRSRVHFAQNTSNASTSAIDTLTDQVGVCRDFAHLMIALCRAVNIPARFVTGIDYGADPALGPTDFHAYVEVFLGDRWYLFDPSGTAIPMGFVRLGSGRDAADVAYATIFGAVTSRAPVISIQALHDAQQNWIEPHHCSDAISTDGTPLRTHALLNDIPKPPPLLANSA